MSVLDRIGLYSPHSDAMGTSYGLLAMGGERCGQMQLWRRTRIMAVRLACWRNFAVMVETCNYSNDGASGLNCECGVYPGFPSRFSGSKCWLPGEAVTMGKVP